MTEEEVLAFVRTSIATTWDLEVLLLLHRTREQSWSLGDLIRELRASHQTVEGAIRRLTAVGVLAPDAQGNVRYLSSDSVPQTAIEDLQRLCLVKPFTVMSAIRDAQSRQLKNFSDAFKFKE